MGSYIGIYWNSIRIRFWMSAPWHLFMWTWSPSNCLERGTALPSPGAQGLSWECAGHRHHNKCRLLWAGCCRLVQGVGTRWISWNETAACLRRCQRLLLISVLHGPAGTLSRMRCFVIISYPIAWQVSNGFWSKMDSTNDKQSSRVSHIAVLAVLAVLSMGGLRDVPNVKSAYKCQEAGVRLEMRMSLWFVQTASEVWVWLWKIAADGISFH